MKKKILEYSYKHGLSHIPSALSMVDYLQELWYNRLVTTEDHIVIGKPFGAQAYYLIWRELGLIDNIEELSMGLKHDEIDFVDYSEETIGNALGVAIGMAMASDKLVWVNITDATLQMGNTLEAIQFIGHHRLHNIMLTIDYNDSQVVGKTSDVISVEPVIEFFRGYGWQAENDLKYFGIGTYPKVFIMNTTKGDGVQTMIDNNKLWHYKKIETSKELQSLVEELPDT
jgi:transketolase